MYSDNRLDKVFRCIVEAYVETAQPVGSKTVSQMYEESLSPATIRNVMAVLEQMGLIEQPHTSAGRIPTERGYRHYVNSFMNTGGFQDEMLWDEEIIQQHISDIESVAEYLAHQLSETTNHAGVMFMKNVRRRSTIFEEFQMLQEEQSALESRVYIDGASKVLRQPEFSDMETAYGLLQLFEEKDILVDLLEKDLSQNIIHIHIGSEVNSEDGQSYRNVSIVAKRYSYRDRPVGCLGVIGPSRMHYERTAGIVSQLADRLTDTLNRF